MIGGGFGAVDALKRLGLERRVFAAGRHKAALDPFKCAWAGLVETPCLPFGLAVGPVDPRMCQTRGMRAALTPAVVSRLCRFMHVSCRLHTLH